MCVHRYVYVSMRVEHESESHSEPLLTQLTTEARISALSQPITHTTTLTSRPLPFVPYHSSSPPSSTPPSALFPTSLLPSLCHSSAVSPSSVVLSILLPMSATHFQSASLPLPATPPLAVLLLSFLQLMLVFCLSTVSGFLLINLSSPYFLSCPQYRPTKTQSAYLPVLFISCSQNMHTYCTFPYTHFFTLSLSSIPSPYRIYEKEESVIELC